MRNKRKTEQYRKVLGEFLPELQRVFDNDIYRDSPLYKKIVRVVSNMERIQEVIIIRSDLNQIIAFARLKGYSDLERLTREVIRLF